MVFVLFSGGGIIAVGYEARAAGVTRRGMRGDDAKKVCPEIKLFSVPEVRGKLYSHCTMFRWSEVSYTITVQCSTGQRYVVQSLYSMKQPSLLELIMVSWSNLLTPWTVLE